MTSEWCCAPFTVPKPPPADQNSIAGWRMVVDFRNFNTETKADSHPLSLIDKEIVKRAKGKLFSVLNLRHGFHQMKPVRTPVAILGSLGMCIYVPASRHWLISYSLIHLA